MKIKLTDAETKCKLVDTSHPEYGTGTIYQIADSGTQWRMIIDFPERYSEYGMKTFDERIEGADDSSAKIVAIQKEKNKLSNEGRKLWKNK